LTPKEKHHVQTKLGRKSWDDLTTWKSLGGGFTYLLFSPLPGEDSHFDEHIFQMGWGKTINQRCSYSHDTFCGKTTAAQGQDFRARLSQVVGSMNHQQKWEKV